MRLVVLVLVLVLACACVERRLYVRTEPPGATVSVNGRVVGTSPTHWRFDHYGTVLVEAELAGHEPVQRAVRLRTPWFQRPIVDFFADVIVPLNIRDDHEVELRLEPYPDETEAQRKARIVAEMAALERRAARLRSQAEGP